MSKTLLVMLRANAEQWAGLLQASLPDHRILTEADGPVDYALVGKPAPGALAALSGLNVVFSVNAGIENLLESGEVPAGIPIVRMVDDGLAEGMLEWVLATTLTWHRNLFGYRQSQLDGKWAPRAEKLARDRQVTVLGAGHLGEPVARSLAQLGFRTRAWSRTAKAIPGVTSFQGPGQLKDAVSGSEILINLLPLTAETENLINSELLSWLAAGAVLINGGRGRHIVDQAVLDLLDAGHLSAAFLDVFREEPLPTSHPFWRHPGVYLSPHVAAPTHAETAIAAIVENIKGYEAGRDLQHVVDLSRGY